MVTGSEHHLRNALKFGTTGEVNSQEGVTPTEWLLDSPIYSEVGAPQRKLNRAMGEAIVLQPPPQCPRTNLIFDVRIDYPFLD